MGYKIEVVEKAILDALKADPTLNYVTTKDFYDGQFGEEDLRDVLGRLPGVFVTYNRDTVKAVTKGATYAQLNQFNIVCATVDLRGKFKSKTGTEGAFQLTEDVHALLHKNELGLTNLVPPGLVRTGRFPRLITPTLSIYEMTFNIEWIA